MYNILSKKRGKKRYPTTTCNFLWKNKLIREEFGIGVKLWAIEPRSSIAIASEDNANEKL